jgi:glyoxylase-like metal-dependent hydrolase (beta-lactamase superfamily II)
VIKDPNRNLVIDTGLNRRECLEAMLEGLSRIGVDLKKTDFYITHFHSDHFALARLLSDETTTVYMNGPDKAFIESWDGWGQISEFALLNGFPREELMSAISNHPGYKYDSDRVPVMIAVNDGDLIRCGGYNFTAVATPGHTIGHTCLYEPARKLLLSGDHILIDITPNIGCWSENANPLKLYLASLNRIHGMQVDLVLPGHRSIVGDCRGRIEELRLHHDRRLEEVLSILKHGPQNAYAAASRMTWDLEGSWSSFPVAQKWFATGEAIAHLRYLEEEGEVVRDDSTGSRVYSIT